MFQITCKCVKCLTLFQDGQQPFTVIDHLVEALEAAGWSEEGSDFYVFVCPECLEQAKKYQQSCKAFTSIPADLTEKTATPVANKVELLDKWGELIVGLLVLGGFLWLMWYLATHAK